MTTLERFGVPGYETILVDPDGRLVEGTKRNWLRSSSSRVADVSTRRGCHYLPRADATRRRRSRDIVTSRFFLASGSFSMEQTSNVTRREVLKQAVHAVSASAMAGITGSLVTRARAAEPKTEMTVEVLTNETIGTIKPALYGHFTEHIGGVIYDGIWVGPDSKIPNIDGIRRALVEHVRRLGKTVIRWPGGCFADRYDWRDGIGPRKARPRRFGRWQEDTESNAFGTHEFLRFCRLCEAEPYLAANVGSGSVEQFQRWVEYCNAPAGRTTLADERVANGDREPFAVRYWGVGNESWGCGGKFTPEDYCTEYRKFTEWVPGYGVQPYFIAAGPNGNDVDWTQRFFKKWSDYARADQRLGRALLLRNDRPRARVLARRVVRDAGQGQRDGEAHWRPMECDGRVRPRS